MKNPKAFVAGYPIAHSLSPVLHGHWLKRYGLAGSYEAREVQPEALPDFLLQELRGGTYVGGNLTLPLKELALPWVDQVTPAARAIGAINTLWLEAGKLIGHNTDATGFWNHLRGAAPEMELRRALVLGAGGAARAVVFALQQAGFEEIAVSNRNLARAQGLIETLPFDGSFRLVPWDQRHAALAGLDLLVNATSLGMQGQPDLDLDLSELPSFAQVYDLVYRPLETPLLSAVRAKGINAIDGLGMLLHQAAPGFEAWFGQKPQVDTELREVLLQAGKLA